MKRILFIILVLIMATGTTFSQSSFGLAGTAGTKTGIDENGESKMNFGVHARMLSSISESIGLIGGFTYYLPSSIMIGTTETKWNFMTFNADIALYLANEEDFKFYGLGGVTYTSARVEVGGASATSEWEFGWEAGAGVIFGEHFFIEGKYDGKLEQIVGVVGFYF